MSSLTAPEEKATADRLVRAREEFLAKAMNPAFGLASRRESEALARHLEDRLLPLFQPVSEAVDALFDVQLAVVTRASAGAGQSMRERFQLTIGVGAAGIVVFIGLSALVLMTMRRSLRKLEDHVSALAADEFDKELSCRRPWNSGGSASSSERCRQSSCTPTISTGSHPGSG